MASISTRASVLAIVPEVTEGVPVEPTVGTQFIAMQDDFAMAPNFETLENAELQASIASSKPIQGMAAPSGSMSHYLRASGAEGVAPGYKELIKTIFDEVAASTEYDTIAGSTASSLKVGVGEGVQFQRGQPLLIKDPINGYRIRCVESVSTDDLSIGFALPSAPAATVNLGKSVFYKPKNTGHGSFSVFHYLGNGGAVQLMSGARLTSMGISGSAGELLNASYSWDGLDFFFDPITITSSTRYIDWTDDDGTFAAAVPTGTYHDPHELAEALQDAMNAANLDETVTVTYSNTTGKFTIKSTGLLLTLLWNTGVNAANSIGPKIGFLVAANDSGTTAVTGYTSDNAQVFNAPYTPSYDANQNPIAMKNQEIMIGDTDDFVCFGAATTDITINQEKTDINSICAASGRSGSLISARSTEITVSGEIKQYDAKHFKNFRLNSKVKFQQSFGEKSGGNWIPGKCGVIFSPSMTITSLEITDEGGVAFVSMTLQGYVDNGQGEIYLGFV